MVSDIDQRRVFSSLVAWTYPNARFCEAEDWRKTRGNGKLFRFVTIKVEGGRRTQDWYPTQDVEHCGEWIIPGGGKRGFMSSLTSCSLVVGPGLRLAPPRRELTKSTFKHFIFFSSVSKNLWKKFRIHSAGIFLVEPGNISIFLHLKAVSDSWPASLILKIARQVFHIQSLWHEEYSIYSLHKETREIHWQVTDGGGSYFCHAMTSLMLCYVTFDLLDQWFAHCHLYHKTRCVWCGIFFLVSELIS